jgi:hypothetical protein
MTIFITGPGRSGTSFLVQLLTRLDFDTGYVPYGESYHEEIRAGCEAGPETDIIENETPIGIKRAFENAPRIIKGPAWAYLLKYLHRNQLVKIEHVVMPLRDLTDSARSRLDSGLDFLMDKEFIKVPGEPIEEIQENVLALLVGKVLEACYIYHIPLTLMRFPRLVQDEEYCYKKIGEFDGAINRDRFGEVFRELANPSQIKWSREAIKEQIGSPT